MLFNSFEFLIFFPIVITLYFFLPHRFRWLLLLLASCGFYMAFIPVYILILIFTIVIDYFAGIIIEQAQGRRRKLALSASIIANIGVLAVFKYFNFFNTNLTQLAQLIHWNYPIKNLAIILPIGLSFHTFQAMSYTIEVYYGNQRAERHFGIYALYVMFFPQLVAGPIERPQNLLHQFYEKHQFDYRRVTDGLKLMAWGLFKKVVIADRLAVYVNEVFNKPNDYHGLPVALAIYFFAFQIYCDFSGYSDIAIGSARVMGFKLMENFDRPYQARSIAEFWQRWHISLSTWFRDYLYIPLGGNRVPEWRWHTNLMVVFLVSGFWHGANWTFILWGAIHGLYLISSLQTKNLRARIIASLRLDRMPKLHRLLQVFITFHLVTFAWIFFRANSVNDAFDIINNVALIDSSEAGIYLISGFELLLAFLSIAVLELIEYAQRDRAIIDLISHRNTWVRWAVYYAIIIVILLFGKFSAQQFIYFQF